MRRNGGGSTRIGIALDAYVGRIEKKWRRLNQRRNSSGYVGLVEKEWWRINKRKNSPV